MKYRHFDEEGIGQSLRGMSSAQRVAFSACCAERLLPLFERYANKVSGNGTQQLASALDSVWNRLSTSGQADVVSADIAISLVPTEQDGWFFEKGYAQNAAAAVAYAIQACNSEDEQPALWCALQVRAVADYAALRLNPSLQLNQVETEETLNRESVVQVALARLEDDLTAVANRDSEWLVLRSGIRASRADWLTLMP